MSHMPAPIATLAAAVTLAAAALLPAAGPQRPAPDWREILGPSRAQLPPAMDLGVKGPGLEVRGGPGGGLVATQVHWRTDLSAALAEARRLNRPVFATLRCLPCKQCADFDKDVLEGGEALTPLLRQFVTVRLTDAANIDLRLLPMADYQDLDLSWWGYCLSPEGRVYAIFGGKDHVSESTRISAAALVNTLRRVLEHHHDPRRAAWDIDGPAPQLTGPAATPLKLPGFERWEKSLGPAMATKRHCLHCHQVAEVMRQPLLDARRFDKHRDTQVWPMPENVGVELDRDDGLRVRRVAAGSAAEAAGIRAGDVLGAAGGRRLFGQADLRGVLHRGPAAAGSIDVVWTRGQEVMTGVLRVADGWRQTPLGWRMSISQGNIGATPGFWPLKGPAGKGRMSVKPFWGPKADTAPMAAGLKKDHVITAVNGQSPEVDGRAFLTWFRMNFEPGDVVTLTVREPGGQTKHIRYRAPARE